MISGALILGWLRSAWKFVSESRFAQIALGILALLGIHAARVKQAERRAVKDEREEAHQRGIEKNTEIVKEINQRREQVREEIEEQEQQDESDPGSRFTRDPFS